MIIYPAIDILGGRCVRLSRGDYEKVTVYSENPVEFVSKWIDMGARYLHVVDLDGARSGSPVNNDVIREIVEKSGVPVQTGGGIRTIGRIRQLFALGISRVILGTAAVKDSRLIQDALKEFGDAIAVGIDARDGYVTTDGWEKSSRRGAVEFAREMESMGVKTIIYTDISTDGMLAGPNVAAMKEMADAVGCEIIASGGVSNINDITALSRTGVKGIIVGKALYEGCLDLRDAIEVSGGGKCLPKE